MATRRINELTALAVKKANHLPDKIIKLSDGGNLYLCIDLHGSKHKRRSKKIKFQL
jgi:hypothetical protein